MPLSRINADRLVSYLAQLSPDVAEFLVREIELHRHAGKDDPVYSLILEAARDVIRSTERSVARLTTPLRLFCSPFADMLVDQTWGARSRARISRNSIEPVWKWLTGGHAPDDLTDLAGALSTATRRNAGSAVETLQREMIDRAAGAIEAAVAIASRTDKAQMRLQAALGGAPVLRDAIEMAAAFRAFDAIARLRAALPDSIAHFADVQTAELMQAMEAFDAAVPGKPEMGFATLLARFAAPTEALRLAVVETMTDDGEKLARSAYGPLGELLLCDTEIAARRVDAAVREGADATEILCALAIFHRYAEGFEIEIDTNPRTAWGHALAGTRRIASQGLENEIRKAPELIAGLFRPYINQRGTRLTQAPDVRAIEMAVRALSLHRGCRPFLDQLSLHEAVMSCDQALQSRFAAIREAVLEDLRRRPGSEQTRLQEWFEAVVELTRAAFGDREAALLARSGKIAGQVGEGAASKSVSAT